jgi:AraC-like DNA-binding protein
MLEKLKIAPRYDGILFLAESARNPPRLKSHRHVELEVCLVVRGAITYVTDGHRFTFGLRSLLWFFPSQEHQLIDCTPDAMFYVALFKPSLISRSCTIRQYEGLKRSRYPKGSILHTRLEPETYDLIRKNMDSLQDGALAPEILNREFGFGVSPGYTFQHDDPDGLNAGLHHLLLLCWRGQATGSALYPAVALHPAVRRAIKLLSEDKFDGEADSLAPACGVSEPYLSRIFHREIGVPLNRYRNTLRLSKFWEIYRRNEKRTFMEAAFAAGFGSYAQFYKIFQQAYGIGPRASLLNE